MLLTHVDLIEKLYVQALLPSHPFSSTHASSSWRRLNYNTFERTIPEN
jgi:hypothetical protein